ARVVGSRTRGTRSTSVHPGRSGMACRLGLPEPIRPGPCSGPDGRAVRTLGVDVGDGIAPVPPTVRRPRPEPASSEGGAGSTPQRTAEPTRRAPVSSRPPPHNLPDELDNQTIRMIARTSLGGRRVWISLSNMLNAEPVLVGAAHLGLHAGRGAIEPGSGRAVT